jgi:hypothetical protein
MAAACPFCIVEAPVDEVFNGLVTPRDYDAWIDGKVVQASHQDRMRAGGWVDVETREAGLTFRMHVDFPRIDENERVIEVVSRARGIIEMTTSHQITCSAVSPTTTRLQMGCDYTPPRGVLGFLLRRVIAKHFPKNVEDSMLRLKRRAESNFKRRPAAAPSVTPAPA